MERGGGRGKKASGTGGWGAGGIVGIFLIHPPEHERPIGYSSSSSPPPPFFGALCIVAYDANSVRERPSNPNTFFRPPLYVSLFPHPPLRRCPSSFVVP